MLWYKVWLETRWRFVIGLAILACSAAGVVLIYPRVVQLIPMVPENGTGGEIGRRIREAADLSREYRGYVWTQWFRQNLVQTGTLFAVLLGSGGLLSPGSGPALFTLSLPVSRGRVLGVRAAAGLLEFFTMVVVSTIVLVLFSPAVGERYSVTAALVHSICAFAAGAVFFSLAFLLSTSFADIWRPLLIAIGIAVVVSLGEQVVPALSRSYGIFGLMSGETYFRAGDVPWIRLLLAAAASGGLLYAARASVARQDF